MSVGVFARWDAPAYGQADHYQIVLTGPGGVPLRSVTRTAEDCRSVEENPPNEFLYTYVPAQGYLPEGTYTVVVTALNATQTSTDTSAVTIVDGAPILT